MANAWTLSALWVGLALTATLLAIWFRVATALFGLNHQIINQAQYSFLVGAVIASAVLPTLIANSFFLPRHLLPHKVVAEKMPTGIPTPVVTGEEA
jgi:inner membrane protein involved in colicin E2 resistance